MSREIEILNKPIHLSVIRKIADEQFAGELVKAVVDIERGMVAIGGAMHADEEALLLQQGSIQQNLWGINIRPNDKDIVEFDSMINLRPSQGNRSRSVEDEAIQQRIREIVSRLFIDE